jgi:hypothetical protein
MKISCQNFLSIGPKEFSDADEKIHFLKNLLSVK